MLNVNGPFHCWTSYYGLARTYSLIQYIAKMHRGDVPSWNPVVRDKCVRETCAGIHVESPAL
eukprot:9469385-Pyramimonas_sp.AAC.1